MIAYMCQDLQICVYVHSVLQEDEEKADLRRAGKTGRDSNDTLSVPDDWISDAKRLCARPKYCSPWRRVSAFLED